ncbi:hypothetical protein [Streptomyces sp. NPDC005548]|uniref:hypothetical protein n=1 Tax=Streptomyces sp. NPDC005548 TaxID=3364724 RepID=UPI0036AD8456
MIIKGLAVLSHVLYVLPVMESRRLWERNAVLANAFCFSDDRVRVAQTALDEALAERSRCLAGFSVTVGSDGAVAQLLGLAEREVRVARRTVGKDDARTVADALLSQANADDDHTETISQHGTAADILGGNIGQDSDAAHPWQGTEATSAAEGAPAGPRAQNWDMPQPAPVQAKAFHNGVPPLPPIAPALWSPILDAVLVGAWHSKLDLTVVAEQFGMDITQLTMRAQQLSAEGKLADSTTHVDRAGRHRRNLRTDQGQAQGRPAPPPHHPPAPDMWQYAHQDGAQQWTPADATTATHDWDGLLHHWQSDQSRPYA